MNAWTRRATMCALTGCIAALLCAPLFAQVTVYEKDPRWLADDGKPFFMCGPGDPEGFLYRGKLNPDGTRDGDQMKLIEKLKGTGANCIYLMAVRSHGGDGDKTENPFIDHDPKKPLNDKLLDQWEEWFKVMDDAGIVIYFFIYDDSARIWDTGDKVGPEEKAFLEALVKRFKHHDYLIWCVAEEYQERFSAKRVSAIAATIRAADDRKHPIAVHKLHGLDFKEFADDPNIDEFAIQYNVKTAKQLHDGLLKALADSKGRYSLNLSECADMGTGAELRKKLWACAMTGANVMVLGMDIEKTPKEDLEACGHVTKFMRAWFHAVPQGFRPDDSLGDHDAEYVIVPLLRPDGEETRVAFGLYGSEIKEGLGLKKLPEGKYLLFWLDCATGKAAHEERVQTQEGPVLLKPPDGIGAQAAVVVFRGEQRDDRKAPVKQVGEQE